jgi:hypothetical protein
VRGAIKDLSGITEAEQLGIDIPLNPLTRLNYGSRDFLLGAQGQPNLGDLYSNTPHIDPLDCPQCSGADQETIATLRGQQGTLQDELRIEQQQGRQGTLQDQQRQINELRQLERQPIQSRDIPREIQQKQNLLRQIQDEISALQHGGPPPGGNPPSSPDQGGPPPNLTPPGSQGHLEWIPDQGTQPDQGAHDHGGPLMYQGEPPPTMPDTANAVRFCVSCSNQNEALKFLNGEPSECSVLP